MLSTHFYLCQGKKQKPGLYLQQAGNKLLNMFLIDVAIQLAVLISWRTTPVSLCKSSKLPQKHWHRSHNNRNWLKQPQIHFHKAIPPKSYQFFAALM